MYYIYHIPNVKIGCTNNPKKRIVKDQGYSEYEILETHDCLDTASDREIELQIQYFGKRDNCISYKRTLKRIARGRIYLKTKEYSKFCSKKQQGCNNSNTSLTEKDIKFIRKVYFKTKNQKTKIPKGKMTSGQLAKMYNCKNTRIWRIVNNLTYTSVK